MKRKIAALITTFAILTVFIPQAMAAYSDYIGNYYTLNTDGAGYAAMDILSCDENSITIDFQRTKDSTEKNIYTCEPGTINGTTAIVPFTALQTSSGQTFTGTITLTLGNMVKVEAYSSSAIKLYEGTLPMVNGGSRINRDGSNSTPDSTVYADVSLNGTVLSFDDNAHARIINDYTFVPLRGVFSNMGINVYWDQYQMTDDLVEQTITCVKNDTIIQFARTANQHGNNVWTLRKWVNSSTNINNSVTVEISDIQPVIIDSHSYVPLRVISESLGADIDWNDSAKTAVINCDVSNSNYMDAETISQTEDFTIDNAEAMLNAQPEFTSTKAFTKPYFSPEGKFYQLDAVDTFNNNITVIVYYNGYIKVISSAPAPSEDDTAKEPVETEVPAEPETPVETEAPAEPETPVETEAPAEPEIPTETQAPAAEPTTEPNPEPTERPTPPSVTIDLTQPE